MYFLLSYDMNYIVETMPRGIWLKISTVCVIFTRVNPNRCTFLFEYTSDAEEIITCSRATVNEVQS